MKMTYKHIYFVHLGTSPKRNAYSCYSNKGDYDLGTVSWYPEWQQFCLEPVDATVFSAGCLRDIADFIDQLK